jgi:D-methionine transport system ATP-binding protein
MIFQSFNLLEQRTVLENVLFPLEISKTDKKAAREKAISLLEEVGLADKLNSYPSQLSGGQKQRVAIARALANNPKVLLCDEATSALDPNTTNAILTLLKEINQKYGITIIVITHEMKVIETICNKVAIIDNSEIVEEGEVKEIFINPKTQIAKDLILPKIDDINSSNKRVKLRLIFDGNVMDPVISTMILQTKVLVNILKANVRTVDGKTYGEMILEISDDVTSLAKVKNFLANNNVTFQEEANYDL